MEIPKIIFIVPYRNRVEQSFFFKKYMTFILEDVKNYEIYFSHQTDSRSFNRGATRNIGFLAMKEKYPNDYKKITFVFNDVDTIPFNKIFNYETNNGIVKHFYGFDYALGGIVSFKGQDFEKINGYPCYWGWGMEDNVLQKRCFKYGLIIDRSQFFPIGSPQILQLFDGISRIISKQDPWRMTVDNGTDGLTTITNLTYDIETCSTNQNDNSYNFVSPNIFYINIKTFETYLTFQDDKYYNYDLREPKRKIVNPNHDLKQVMNTITTTNEWSNIPHYPTTVEQYEKIINDLKRNGKKIPKNLMDNYNKSKNKMKDPYEPQPNNTSISLQTSNTNTNKKNTNFSSKTSILNSATFKGTPIQFYSGKKKFKHLNLLNR